MTEESTLKADILEALRKERARLNAIDKPTDEEETRLSLTIEFIKFINQSQPGREATLEIRNHWMQPIRL